MASVGPVLVCLAASHRSFLEMTEMRTLVWLPRGLEWWLGGDAKWKPPRNISKAPLHSGQRCVPVVFFLFSSGHGHGPFRIYLEPQVDSE